MLKYCCLLIFFALSTSALAQQDASPQQVLRGSETDVARRVLVIGDTLSGGLGAGLQRITETEAKFDVTFRTNESSGLARTEIYDWAQALPNILEANDYWATVIMIGSNDRRDIKDKSFKSDGWIEAYSANVGALVDVLKNQGVKVFWVGNPPFEDSTLNEDLVFITGLQKKVVEERGEVFVDLYAPLVGADGKYTDTGPDETGSVRKLRSRDGVGFYKQGNNRLGQIVLGALQVRDADDKFSGVESASQALPETPLFGRTGVNGEPVVFDSQELAADLKKVAANTKVDQPEMPAAAATQSETEQLFITGGPLTGPKGRFDDFSAEAPSGN